MFRCKESNKIEHSSDVLASNLDLEVFGEIMTSSVILIFYTTKALVFMQGIEQQTWKGWLKNENVALSLDFSIIKNVQG